MRKIHLDQIGRVKKGQSEFGCLLMTEGNRQKAMVGGSVVVIFSIIFLFVLSSSVSAADLFAEYLTSPRLLIQGQETISLRIPDFGPDGLKGLSPEQIKKLQAGEVVMTSSPEVTPDGHSVIAAVVLFKVPVERAWEILSATDRQIDYLEEIKDLRVVEEGEDFNRTEFEVKVMGQKVRYTVIHHFLPEFYYLWWELDKKAPHDLKALSGFWRLYPAGEGKTIGRYGSRVVPAFPVPASIRTWLFKNSVRSSLEKVKAYVEKLHSEKPAGTL